MGEVYAGALLTEQAAWERAERQTDRKALVARLYAARYLADRGPLRGIDTDGDEAIERFDELVSGAVTGLTGQATLRWSPRRCDPKRPVC